MNPCKQVTKLCGALTCAGTGAERSSSGNGSSLLFGGDGGFDASLPPFPGIIKLAATPTSLAEWLLFLDMLTATEPTPSNTKTDKRYITTNVQILLIY